MEHFYTDEINTLILVSLLKEHKIRKVIASPGTTNISFVGSIQNDPFFEVYSAVDERAAAYIACGLAEESGEPVVLSCTGATASRNYIPGLTEAYYRQLPILAVTSTQQESKVGNYVAQVIDRSEQFPDMVKKSIHINTVHSEEEQQYCITSVNDAILELEHGVPGPVHLNLATTYSNGFTIKSLPHFRTVKRYSNGSFPDLIAKRVAVFVGAHSAFSNEEIEAIDLFCENNNAVVICDQISNFRGKYRFLASLANSQDVNSGAVEFDLIIYIGSVHGVYLNFWGKELWRVNPDGIIRDPYNNITAVFEMEELTFFKHYSSKRLDNIILPKCMETTKKALSKIPELPFSNMWIAKETAGLIPDNAILHMSILNTLRAWNYFETKKTVLCYTNSGGYGIDGCLSSFIGSALANQEKEHYLIIGDLSFFYDVNTLLNQLPRNIHIMLINNGVGAEFKNYNHRAAYFGEEANNFMAAKGHNGFKNCEVVQKLCMRIGIKYYSAASKEEYLNYREDWLGIGNGPVLIEIFTTDKDESDALRLMNTILRDDSVIGKFKRSKMGHFVRRLIKGK